MIERQKPSDAQIDDHEPTVDMSPAAISRRLDLVSELYELGRHLTRAKPVNGDCAETPAGEDSVKDR